MWLLSAECAELHFFPSPEDVEDGYATLSHVWGEEEQSFQDVRRIQERCARDRTNPRDFVCEKIRRCCELAEKHGYQWVWIDTCCIDKTSSAELSEAINSMFRYYSLARICYGYLRDVPSFPSWPRARTDKEERKLLHSIWFRRGWTLQELIAPRFFVFLSQSWAVLGTKADFADLLAREVDIPAVVLRHEVSHMEFSIARRMSWFRNRKTTRQEDEAYCLPGIFNIHMPTLYGEGKNAFRRLQEEIMKQSADTTLFAWDPTHLRTETHSSLFALSPAAFQGNRVAYTPLLPTRGEGQGLKAAQDLPLEWQDEGADDMTFSITPHGVLAYIPVISCKNRLYADLSWSEGDSDAPGPGIFLCLEEVPVSSERRTSRRPLYTVCCPRILRMDDPWKAGAEDVTPSRDALLSWQTVLIRHRSLPAHHALPAIPRQLALDAPFRFDEFRIDEFQRQCDADHVEICNAKFQSSNLPHRADFEHPTAYIFAQETKRTGGKFLITVIKVGICVLGMSSGYETSRPGAAPVYATVAFFPSSTGFAQDRDEIMKHTNDPMHDCLWDHVSRWPRHTKQFDTSLTTESRFRDSPQTHTASVTLSFKRCPINPERTVVLDAAYEHHSRDIEIKVQSYGDDGGLDALYFYDFS